MPQRVADRPRAFHYPARPRSTWPVAAARTARPTAPTMRVAGDRLRPRGLYGRAGFGAAGQRGSV